MAVNDTVENKRTLYTEATINSIYSTVDLKKHELIIVDNDSCRATQELLDHFAIAIPTATVIRLSENIGTARAINKAWNLRKHGQHCIKMDNDVVINHSGWVEEMERAIALDDKIGQVGLKRKDCWEYPDHTSNDFKSTLKMLSHTAGEPWVIVEIVKHVIGTCVMHSADLIEKVGYLYQPSLYGYDDVIMSHRTHLAGFYSCFLPHIDIDHIDTGETEYQGWKERHSGEQTQKVIDLVHDMYNGKAPIYYPVNY